MKTMETSYDCGPVASFNAQNDAGYGMEYDDLLEKWIWPGGDSFFANFRDQPGDHFTFMLDSGIKFMEVTCGDILSGKALPIRTVILWHYEEGPYLYQHWVNLAGLTETEVLLYSGGRKENGDPEVWRPSRSYFEQRYADASPACAYMILSKEDKREQSKLTGWDIVAMWWSRLLRVPSRAIRWLKRR